MAYPKIVRNPNGEVLFKTKEIEKNANFLGQIKAKSEKIRPNVTISLQILLRLHSSVQKLRFRNYRQRDSRPYYPKGVLHMDCNIGTTVTERKVIGSTRIDLTDAKTFYAKEEGGSAR